VAYRELPAPTPRFTDTVFVREDLMPLRNDIRY